MESPTYKSMTANFWDIVRYFKRYRTLAIWSISAASLFEIIDLIVTYTVGQIQLAMRRIQGTRTTIVIAHRLSTVREADKIVVLDKGQVVEIVSHQQLLSQGGIYHRLHSLQETGGLALLENRW
jgi:ABC-type thiamine transport system ATPase subunit